MTARKVILAAVAALGLAGASLAEGRIPPPHVTKERLHPRNWGPNLAGEDYVQRGNFWYNIGFRKWPAVMPAYETAPWYLWWPANANETMLRTDFQTSPYPGWQSPPQSPPMHQMTTTPNRSAHQPASYPPAPVNFYGR